MCAHFIQANTNGRLHSAEEPSIAPLNRGFLYGDAIYEVWRTYHGIVIGWDEHWARLERSAVALYMTLPWSQAMMLEEIKKTTAAYRKAAGFAGDLYIRLQVTRGGGAIGLDIALADKPDFVLLVQPQTGEPRKITGMYIINDAKLRALSSEQILELHKLNIHNTVS